LANRLASLGVALGGHLHDLKTLVSLARSAEAAGFRALYLDGDLSFRASRPEAQVLHSMTATAALLARTRRIEIGSLRLVTHWNAAQLAQASATASHIAPGRLRLFLGTGAARSADARIGLPNPSRAQRLARLDEFLAVLPALFRGECVSHRGRFVRLEAFTLYPPADGPLSIELAGRSAALLERVARGADRWDINLPPVPRLVRAAERALASACQRVGRAPDSIVRSMWITTRVAAHADAALRCAFPRNNPFYPPLTDAELDQAIVAGEPLECLDELERIGEIFSIALPIVDLSGQSGEACRRALDALASHA